jgi:hypothetical protein
MLHQCVLAEVSRASGFSVRLESSYMPQGSVRKINDSCEENLDGKHWFVSDFSVLEFKPRKHVNNLTYCFHNNILHILEVCALIVSYNTIILVKGKI